jgi:hypothetical protein
VLHDKRPPPAVDLLDLLETVITRVCLFDVGI